MDSTVNAKQKKQEDMMQREIERLLRAMVDAAPFMIRMCGPDRQCTYFNRRWLDFTGRPAASELGTGWTGSIHPDDLQRCLDHCPGKIGPGQENALEYRLRRHDGEYCWVSEITMPRTSADGSFAGSIGLCLDISGYRRAAEMSSAAAEACSAISLRLLEAQEEERTRLARELHDDIGASLAILGVELLQAGKPVSGSPGGAPPEIPDLYEKVQEIAKKVSRISRRLHSPALDYMGLAKAIQIECREFSERSCVQAECSCSDIPDNLDKAVGLSCLRVTEQALDNAARHGAATRVEVELTAASGLLNLLVRDNGKGFDIEKGRFAPGLGLISMRERMRMVGGEFEIKSQPGRGTEVICRVPLGALPA